VQKNDLKPLISDEKARELIALQMMGFVKAIIQTGKSAP